MVERPIEKVPPRWTQDEICSELTKLCDRIGASEQIKETAKSICKQAFELGLRRGRSMLSIIASAVFMAMRENSQPITFRDFAERIHASPKQKQEIFRYYRTLFDELSPTLPVIDPSSYVREIADKMHSSKETIESSLRLIKVAESMKPEITGRNPIAVAAAAVYLSSLETGERATEKDLAIAAGVTEACVRNSVKLITNNHRLRVRQELPIKNLSISPLI